MNAMTDAQRLATAQQSPEPFGGIYHGGISEDTDIPATIFNPAAPPSVLISWAWGQMQIIRDMTHAVMDDERHHSHDLASAVYSLVCSAQRAMEEAANKCSKKGGAE